MQRYQREHFWNAVIWPVLWPLLLVQAALVLLCVLVGAVIWLMSPGQASWSTTLWLTLTLLLGSCLNVGAFLMLIKARAKFKDALFIQGLNELERRIDTLQQGIMPHAALLLDEESQERPLKRLTRANDQLASLVSALQKSGHVATAETEQSKSDQALLDDLHHQQKQLKHLMAGRERAREESRLKSGYLTLMQREADSLFDHLGTMLTEESSEACRQNVTHVRERLADIRSLLANFVQQSVNEADTYDLPLSSEQSPRVLVVDDGPVNLMLARQMLELQGLHVEGVSSGEQALERQQSAFYDLVFMDIFMPTLDGLETTRRWRRYEHQRATKRSVMIALTANADTAGQDACSAAGLDDILAKPYQPDTLHGMIKKWLPNALEKPNE
ncbi:response regulator [Halomonas sp. DSH1-27]|nr:MULTISPECIES: response regulator [unclassified Halomonas]MCG7577186.1 response regulator [Halomonas sp. MMH1-48]MCG7604251.1 response regulator [Halomonas sp. MM17-34]MCG7613500.1 response regulator [Halomonas sp. MM17-29]MCG7620274.1 response regulator [Halomonas sp. DSH1-27]